MLSVASNPGHLLWSGIVPPDRAARVVARLMAPDMNSGWGIRTLSSRSPGVQSLFLSERLGVAARQQPDRTWFQAIRLLLRKSAHRPRHQRGGEPFPAEPIARTLCRRRSAVARSFPVQYLGANVPQAWAAGSVFALLQAMLGIEQDAPNQRSMDRSRSAGLASRHHNAQRPVGCKRFSLRFVRDGEHTTCEVLEGDSAMVQRRPFMSEIGRP